MGSGKSCLKEHKNALDALTIELGTRKNISLIFQGKTVLKKNGIITGKYTGIKTRGSNSFFTRIRSSELS